MSDAPPDTSPDTSTEPPSERSRIKRLPDKAVYDRRVVDAILDAGLVAHVGVVGDDGCPFVVPVVYARIRDEVVVHGSVASRLLRAGAGGAPVCLTVTLVDGIIVARSLFESSMRYRSVVVMGQAREIADPDEHLACLLALSDRLIPGRVAEARGPSESELRQTRVFALPLDEASAKVNDGWPDDPPEDLTLDIWAGVVPFRTVADTPTPAPDLRDGIAVPPSVERFSSP